MYSKDAGPAMRRLVKFPSDDKSRMRLRAIDEFLSFFFD
jgi:hypothetical protein